MSTAADEDERRRRSLEAGREMLEKYKAERSGKSTSSGHSQTEDMSDEESFHDEKSMERRASSVHEGISSKDITHSSVSMSEGEGDGDLEGLAGRVAELEELLHGKEVIVEALNAEIDHLRAEASSPNSSQSQSSSTHSRDLISTYRTRLHDFVKAINQRDNLIENLTQSLKEALAARATVVADISSMNATQIPDACALNANLQEKIGVLKKTLSDQESSIEMLNSELVQVNEHVRILEAEKETRNAEINDYKLQIKNLNEQMRRGAENNFTIAEALQQQKEYETRMEKVKHDMQHILEKFTAETNANAAKHKQELKDMSAKHEIEIMNIQKKYEEHTRLLKEENKALTDRLNKELPDLETKHAKELSVFQSQLSHYKKTVETLKHELVDPLECQKKDAEMKMLDLKHQKEKEMLSEQIKLHKIQLEDMTTKYVTATAILESKESLEHSLEQALMNAAALKQENDTLKFKIDDLSSRYSAAQSMIENGQAQERTLSTRIYDLEKSLTRLSGINVSTLSELNETAYPTLDEVAIQFQFTKQKLEEKAELEKLLTNKIEGLQNEVQKTKEDLKQANLCKRSYEKQLKDMENTCDKLRSELVLLKESNSSNAARLSLEESKRQEERFADLLQKVDADQQEIRTLKSTLEQKEIELADYVKRLTEATEKLKKTDDECDQLKNGLAIAWAQCAEVQEKLNETLGLTDSRLDTSLSTSNYSSALMKQFRSNRTVNDSTNSMHDQSVDTNRSLYDRGNETDDLSTKAMQARIASALEEKEYLSKELELLKQKYSDYEELKNKLYQYTRLSEQYSVEKDQMTEENECLKRKLEGVRVLQESVNQLRAEKETLRKEIEALIREHNEQMSAIKAQSATEVRKMQTELEVKHKKDLEELRTYFEQKCLQMEKQYSEEVFSQQSKKVSDNDSELEELTEDLYCGGAGDCLNVSNISEPVSRAATPIEDRSKCNNDNFDGQRKTDIEYESNIKALQLELEQKIIEIQELKLRYEQALDEQKNLYERDIYSVKQRASYELLRNTVNQHCQTEWDAGALENGELSQLRAAYDHQLEEQITLARLDIVNALQEQIQALLTVEGDGDDNWPAELLELRDKFTSNAKREIQQLREVHAADIHRLKEEFSRSTARMIDRHQEELNKLKAENASIIHNSDRDIIKERDSLHKMCVTLKVLVEELIKYFVTCEEEVNNTLITEVLKRQLSDNQQDSSKNDEKQDSTTKETKDTDESNDTLNSSEIKIKRVHFAPQTTEIVSIISNDTDTLQTMFEEDDKITEKLKQELSNCLRRLKTESAEIFGTVGGDRTSEISKEIVWVHKLNEELTAKLSHAEAVIMSYQEETERLKINILELHRKLASLGNKKEIITEGYGEHDDAGGDITLQDFSQLQEKARHVLSNGGGDSSYLLQLIEELCRQSDKLMDDAKREREDLQQQIDAADKQLKATRRFLDEQASEREAERDEASRQIRLLQEQLKERDREKERDMRITSEPSLSPETSSDVPVLQATDNVATVEALESQIREMSSLVSDTEAKKFEIENELKAALDKIWVLREIITELEQQLQQKADREDSLQTQINQLETVIAAQTKNQHELVQELDSVKMGSENRQLNEHINHLQEELRKHKLSFEQFSVNSAALKQMKVELKDMQSQLDKRIKNLEAIQMSGSNLSISQPSEDVSIREHIEASRCPTPDDPDSPPMLPLDQILKLKEKILKHARVEEVAIKKIKDLEIQLTSLRNQNEELREEQEILQQTTSDQLFEIEAMRGRLAQHKQSAPFAQRQATSRLELQLHEANAKFQSLERTIADKELELKDLKNQLDRVNQLLLEKEAEITNVVQVESATIEKLKNRLEIVEEEKKSLQAKIGAQEHAQLELPRLIDSMLADKNEEIDHLKEQLSKKEKQLEAYTSLALDDEQLKEMMQQVEPKNSARTLSDILSIQSECGEMSEAIRAAPNTTQLQPHNVSIFKVPTSSVTPKDTLDVSVAPFIDVNRMSVQVPPLDLGSHSQSLSSTSNRHSNVTLGVDLIHSGLESKISSPEDNVLTDDGKVRDVRVSTLQESLDKRSNDNVDNSNRTGVLGAHENSRSCAMSTKHTQTSLNETIKEIEVLENRLQAVQEELQLKSAILDKREADLRTLQKIHEDLQTEFKEVVETLSRDKRFYQSQYELSRASESKIKKDLQEIENTLKLTTEEMQEQKSRMQVNEKIIMELNTENARLRKGMEGKEEEQIRKYTGLLQENMKDLQTLRDAILEKDITIETIQTRNIEIENENKQLYEYKQEVMKCQNEIQRLTEGLNNRDQIIRRLEEMARRTSLSGASSPSDEKDQEIHHLQEHLKEKDEIIRQMSDDSKSLHRALKTIQNKMKESGNVVELRKKLKEERKLNAELKEMVEKLSKELNHLKLLPARRSQDDTDIEDMVQRELNLSAHLDRQIMNAIESDPEDGVMTIERQDQDQQENNIQRIVELKLKLSQSNKINDELKKLKDDLEIERGMLKCQIAEYEGRIFQLKSDLIEESKKVAKLDENLSVERNMVRNLKIKIEKDQREMQSGHTQDSDLIEFLKEKLKSSVDSETKLRNELSLLRQQHKSLEIHLSSIKEHIEFQKTDELTRFTDLLETERKKYTALMEDFEREERNNVELRDGLKKAQMERNRYEKHLEVAIEEKEKLISSLALVEGIKEHLETDLRRTKEELKAREKECEWLQKRIKTMTDAEAKRQEQRTSEHNELKGLRREINNAREVMMDLEADMKQSKREFTDSVERELKLTERLESLKEKEAELAKKLSIARDDEKKLKETIADLQQELKMSTKRELELTKELRNRFSSEKNTPTKVLEKISYLSETIERHVNEKGVLREKLTKAREEKEQLLQRVKILETELKQSKSSHDVNMKNVKENLHHFWGTYLRAKSRYRALTFQKHYLLIMLSGHCLFEENTLSMLARLTDVERSCVITKHKKKSPKVRFRSAALVIISIHRMKWLILRWRTGKRTGVQTLLCNMDQSFIPIQRDMLNHSPPVRERPTSNGDGGIHSFELEQYYQRFRNIQQTLGLAMAESATRQIIPE